MSPALHTQAVRILLSLYLLEAALLLIVVGIYKAPASDWTLLSTKAGAVLSAGVLGAIVSGWHLVGQIKAGGALRGRAFALGLMANLLSGLVAFLLMETAVRIAAHRTPRGILVGSVVVRPTWPELVERSHAVLASAAPWGTWDAAYFVPDQELGWTVGPNRRSANGLYFSSLEGIRSGAPDVRFAERISRFRVALIGDSNAFSYEVPFEDSWGYHLQRVLGEDVQVLNFGVDGYGIDQMYLRYQRDVRRWKPSVVVIGFIGDDFLRTMTVYPFVTFGWPGYIVKPRFVLEVGELRLLNAPLPTFNHILGVGRIQELPFVEYDLGYQTKDWTWRFDHGPFVLRYLTSVFPRWPAGDPRVSEEAMKALNSRVFAQLVASIKESGAVPVVVLMSPRNALVTETLARAGVTALDATACLAEIPADQRKVPSGHHYTGPANLAIARCTAPHIKLPEFARG